MTRLPAAGLLALLGLVATVGMLVGCAENPPPPPPQPIAYSHKAHIDAELECDRCHRGAERAAQAGLPEMRACLSCHRRVIPDHPEIVKFRELAETGEPLLWRKVNVMPKDAMVHFHHGAHTLAGVTCETCHGDVGQMALAQRVINTADMGWCVDCHREEEASIDCLTCHH